jgi:autoinducer 2-degrading protein
MIVRIVKMEFHEEKLGDFYLLFKKVRNQIATFPGCNMLKIYSDKSDKTIIFTHSEWISEEDLNRYRNSTLFQATWAETKKLFKAAPMAWSMEEMN